MTFAYTVTSDSECTSSTLMHFGPCQFCFKLHYRCVWVHIITRRLIVLLIVKKITDMISFVDFKDSWWPRTIIWSDVFWAGLYNSLNLSNGFPQGLRQNVLWLGYRSVFCLGAYIKNSGGGSRHGNCLMPASQWDEGLPLGWSWMAHY